MFACFTITFALSLFGEMLGEIFRGDVNIHSLLLPIFHRVSHNHPGGLVRQLETIAFHNIEWALYLYITVFCIIYFQSLKVLQLEK